MNNKFKKLFAVLFVITVFACLFSVNISAEDGIESIPENNLEVSFDSGFASCYADEFNSSTYRDTSIDDLEKATDLAVLKQFLMEELRSCPNSIDLSSLGIPGSNDMVKRLGNFIFYHVPELFHIQRFNISWRNGIFTTFTPTYRVGAETGDVYVAKYNAMVEGADILLEGIENNDNLTEVEKALLLHDRLAVWNEYDYTLELPLTHTAYLALAERTSVCQGYAMAYMYLLQRVGIENYYCNSEQMNHGWNIVYIDGIPYHVDVTHDDFKAPGKFSRKNFLVSTSCYRSNGHNYYDFDSTPADTRYENAFWRNSITAFQLVNDELYFIDNTVGTLNKYDNGVVTKLLDIESTYGRYYIGYPNQACLAATETELLFSANKNVYSYNPVTKVKNTVYTSPSSVSNNYIYGLEYRDYTVICYLSTDLQSFTIEKSEYDIIPPKAVIKSTNNVSNTQTVTLSMSDNLGIIGYYWGNNSSYVSNKYTQITETKSIDIPVTVSESGKYYLTVTDKKMNLSNTVSIIFLSTKLSDNYGSVPNEKTVLTPAGNSFKPVASFREGYKCIGWATKKDAVSGVNTIVPFSNLTYYAIWEIAQNEWVEGDGNWYYYNENGEIHKGWLVLGENKYYLNEKGVMQKGWTIVDDTWYYFNDGGVMANGWQWINGHYYYMNEAGEMQTGWQWIDGNWFYFNAGGVMATGWEYINGFYYYMNEGGFMQTGWQWINGSWFHFNAGGVMSTGWQYIGGYYYYMNEGGFMQTGWQWINGSWFHFNSGGVMSTGWQYIGGQYYYFNNGGFMQIGWQWIDGKWFYFNTSGVWVG